MTFKGNSNSTGTWLGAAMLGVAATMAVASAAQAGQDPERQVRAVPGGLLITPGSSLPHGITPHTNYHIFVPSGIHSDSTSPTGHFETPASLACLYGVTAPVAGCNPETLKTVATTGSKVIAIVDAYDYPTAANDLGVYSAQFGLPPVTSSNFQVVYASGTKPPQDSTGGWESEEALDIEMAHALAPNAKVILVEATSNSGPHLLQAEAVATKLVAAAGGGEVSNSWSGGEYATEEKSEKLFAGKNVVYFASAGDSPGTGWPAVLSNVVSVGGTTVTRSSSGVFKSQSTWASTGGGLSAYVKTPAYQSGVASVVGTARGVPDIALVANPFTGVWIYDTTPNNGKVLNWAVFGGTSVSSPATAAIINSAGTFNASSVAELTEIYKGLGNKALFTDITKGSCPNAAGGTATVGYDLCTGVGTPLGLKGK